MGPGARGAYDRGGDRVRGKGKAGGQEGRNQDETGTGGLKGGKQSKMQYFSGSIE